MTEFKSPRSPKQDRALYLFTQKGYVPHLSTHPMYRFTDKKNNKIIKVHIDVLVEQYDEELKEKAKERQRNRKIEGR